MSRYAQREQDNDAQFNLLANKLSTLRNITEDINQQAQQSETIEALSNNFSSMMSNLKNTSSKLTRSMSMGNGVWRNVGIALVLFFLVWTIFKIF